MEASPDTSPYLRLARNVLQLSRAVARRIDPVLSERLGINGRELFVLRAVERGEGNLMRIAERLVIAPSSASRIFDRLVDRGLVERGDDPDDRRKTRPALTAQGRETVRQALAHVEEALEAAYRDLPRADVEHAACVLESLVAHAEPDERAVRKAKGDAEAGTTEAGLHG